MFLRCDALGRVLLFGLGPTCDEAFLASSRVRLGKSKRHFLGLGRVARNKGVPRSLFHPDGPATEERALLSRFRLWLGRADDLRSAIDDRRRARFGALQALQAARP
ncbi:hypothetical protein, partial [Roseiarcus sp.]|uniref:hypothetical protein n=1 Tax=Roseiarcus sp. TaxID=1969460 RepID=UPI003C75B5AC